MAIEIIRATYTEQNALELFLTSIFGQGTATVIVRGSCRERHARVLIMKWKRGRFHCTIPRGLTEVGIPQVDCYECGLTLEG